MDVLPAHLNRDFFRDSFKGLVVLEIIIDLPIGFPINNIISLFFLPHLSLYSFQQQDVVFCKLCNGLGPNLTQKYCILAICSRVQFSGENKSTLGGQKLIH